MRLGVAVESELHVDEKAVRGACQRDLPNDDDPAETRNGTVPVGEATWSGISDPELAVLAFGDDDGQLLACHSSSLHRTETDRERERTEMSWSAGAWTD